MMPDYAMYCVELKGCAVVAICITKMGEASKYSTLLGTYIPVQPILASDPSRHPLYCEYLQLGVRMYQFCEYILIHINM